MAWLPLRSSFLTQTDLSASPFCAVAYSGNKDLALCGAGARPAGFTGKAGDIPSDAASGTIRGIALQDPHSGMVKIKTGGAISASGTALASDASGQAVEAVIGDEIIGYSTKSSSSGDIVEMQPVDSGIYFGTGDLTVYSTSFELSAAQVQTLNATPVQVLAAPGAGLYIEPIVAHWWLDHGGTDYDAAGAGEDLTLKYTDASGAKIVSDVDHSGFGDASADAHAVAIPVAVVPVANAAIVAHILSGEWYSAAGDSPVKLEFTYRIRTLEFSV